MSFLNLNLLNKNMEFSDIHTLGPCGTSSEYAANKLLLLLKFKKYKIYLYNTYEEAYTYVKDNKSGLFLVANAYKNVDTFYMLEDLKLSNVFICDTPKYGIACRKDFNYKKELKKKNIRLLTHRAPIQKLIYLKDNIFLNNEFSLDYVNSTSIFQNKRKYK